jgi:hypothetical protein
MTYWTESWHCSRITLVASLEPESLLAAIEVATGAFLVELRRGEPALCDRLEGPLLEFVRLRG